MTGEPQATNAERRGARAAFRKRRPPPGAPPGTIAPHPDAPPPRLYVMEYSAAGMRETALDDLATLADSPPDGAVRWLSIQGFGDAAVLEHLGARFGIHPLALADIVNTPQRPKLDPYDDHLLLIARAARRDAAGHLATQQIALVLFERCVLSFEEEHGQLLEPVRQRLRHHAVVSRLGADFLCQAILDAVVDGYYPLLEELGEELDQIEEDVINRPSRRVLHRIHRIKTGLLSVRRAIWPQRDAIQAVLRHDSPLFTAESMLYFRDLHDHSAQIVDVVESYRDIAAGLMEVYLTTINNRTGERMKVLTVIATIFIPLTFLVGVYGMNFRYMPELDLRWAYPALWAFMLAIGGAMLFNFWRLGWLTREDTLEAEPPRQRRRTGAQPHSHRA